MPEYSGRNRTIVHYNDVIMTTVASQITSLTVVYSIVYSDADQRKHQSSASLAIVRGSHRDRWIPRTKGQLRGKCFHLMTSSCHNIITVDALPPCVAISSAVLVFTLQDDCAHTLPWLLNYRYMAVEFNMILNTKWREETSKKAETLCRLWTHKRHPIAHPFGEFFGEKVPQNIR